MSAATATRAVTTATRSLRPTRTPARIRKGLKRDDRGLPIPHVNVLLRDMHPSRLGDHYHATLQDNLMYMTYLHETGPRPPPRAIRLTYDPEDPYTKNRYNPPVGGSQFGKKPAPPTTVDNVVRLERIVLHTMIKEAVNSKSALLAPLMMMRALSGETEAGGGRHTKRGVEVVRGIKASGGWVRKGAPLGVKVEITGPKMYDFLATLVEFVFPRLRDFSGIVLPHPTSNMQTPAGVSGVVTFGLPPEVIGFFPQLEVNIDSYPKLPGMHIQCITNAEGQGAQNKARALLSGFQVPFARR